MQTNTQERRPNVFSTAFNFSTPQFSLRDGVVKLEDTGRIVKGLKQELIQLQPLLESKAKEAEGLLKQVRGFGVSRLGASAPAAD